MVDLDQSVILVGPYPWLFQDPWSMMQAVATVPRVLEQAFTPTDSTRRLFNHHDSWDSGRALNDCPRGTVSGDSGTVLKPALEFGRNRALKPRMTTVPTLMEQASVGRAFGRTQVHSNGAC